MNNLENKNMMQKRILIATLVAFIFFIAYDFFLMKPKRDAAAEQAKVQTEMKKDANAAPQANVATAPDATTPAVITPMTKSISTKELSATVKTKNNIFELDKFGRIAQVTLLKSQYVVESGAHIQLFEANQLRPLEVRFSDRDINAEAFKVNVVASASNIDATTAKQELTLTQTLSGTTLTKKFTFFPDGHYDLTVTSTNSKPFFITPGFRPNVLADMYADHGVYLKMGDNTMNLIVDEDSDKTESFTGVKFASAFDRYYATVLYNLDKTMQVTIMPDNNKNPQAFIHVNDKLEVSGYAGPKEFKALNALSPELTDVIEYGWFTFIAKPMFILLQYLHNLIGNWGWTIVVLTVLIKLVLYPLSYKGMVSMQKLKDLAPKIKDIQAKYKDDKQKQSMHMMELYKKHGANPMGGCLPIVLQIPVFFAIYRVLLNSIELKGAEWILWINDLAEMDPYYVLPILMGATMFLQQKITPNTLQDETQKKIFQFLPVIFTFFFLWFPAGLTLYWFINNVFTVAQQYYINQLFEKQRAARK